MKGRVTKKEKGGEWRRWEGHELAALGMLASEAVALSRITDFNKDVL